MTTENEPLPPCGWKHFGETLCGMPSKYELGWPGEEPVPLCSKHFSRASTLGWPTCQVIRNKIKEKK